MNKWKYDKLSGINRPVEPYLMAEFLPRVFMPNSKKALNTFISVKS